MLLTQTSSVHQSRHRFTRSLKQCMDLIQSSRVNRLNRDFIGRIIETSEVVFKEILNVGYMQREDVFIRYSSEFHLS